MDYYGIYGIPNLSNLLKKFRENEILSKQMGFD